VNERIADEGLNNLVELKKFSSKNRLIRVTAWLYRFVNNCRSKNKQSSKFLTTAELSIVEELWIKEVQREIERSDGYLQLKEQLNLSNESGILRCRGRLHYSGLSLNTRQPILLPKNHYFTELVIKEAHSIVLHDGVNATLAEVRRNFWIPKGRQAIRRVLRSCNYCFRSRVKPFESTITAPLPEERVRPARPFNTVGCDFAGPIYLKNNKK